MCLAYDTTHSELLPQKSDSKSKAIINALIYGVSIIVIYLLLGLIITLAFGPSTLNELATGAVFNVFFFVLLVFFAISFFGAFEITMPSKWTNAVSGKAGKTTGLFSLFFMAFTLVLVSFSCTGPIIGTLLVEAVSQGNIIGPAIGMFGFALALAVPFALFAMFPSVLKGLPKSGGWLSTVKVVLGFIELALSLKFLSVADLAYGWHILDREVFISLWIVIFALLGLYLLKVFRFSGEDDDKGIGAFRLILATISLSFAMYLVPGLWGAPLKSISAFAPPLSTQDFNLYESGKFQEYDDFDKGMDAAKEAGKPVFLDFSGYGCVNCRKMEAAVFDNQRIRSLIEENFVMITLMADDKRELPEILEINTDNGVEKMRTYGDLWSY
ncbi:MAG: thioredoxin family protein, partial [Candidatus Limisoma sp.]|nr:thioredoxin family protein [Candidatus Limisoma sp.]